VKWFGKYRRKLWSDRENMEENSEMIWKIWKKSKSNSEKIWKIEKKIPKWYGKYGRKVSWIVKRFGKYRRKLWNDMENMDEMWNDMEAPSIITFFYKSLLFSDMLCSTASSLSRRIGFFCYIFRDLLKFYSLIVRVCYVFFVTFLSIATFLDSLL
jgi:rRNA maturation protein Nop10